VQADFSVELGRDDPTLEVPWENPEGTNRYLDLKRQPELLRNLPEIVEHAELGDFLSAVNSTSSVFETAKCDAWSTTEINPEDEIFGATWKYGCYTDLLFSNDSLRVSFEAHEKLVGELTQLLKKAPELPASAEFLIRRCYWHLRPGPPISDNFYVTCYVFGYAQSEEQARRQWAIALKLVENAIRQVSAQRQKEFRR
jgi:hypothetical protein